MQGLANQRGLAPLFNDGPVALRDGRGARFAKGPPQRAATGRQRLRATREMLDGIGGLGWSVMGFVGGAVVWHFIGFWGFVSEVVLAGGSTVAERPAIHASAPKAPPHWVQVAEASAPPCTVLSLDRRTGVTSARSCEAEHGPLPADSFQGREDRISAVGRDGRIRSAQD
ncbi:hypothetical protein [Hyphomicrobium sp.]|uniref:hypothetical protein n=1 Tax=Hyphomicrobium sp. TaxID=82 RepID=UPI0025B9F06C|nr:hypothetical protein [Hyphomicrobium sp.]MCC7253421.1 hypothetical protein [Hyphomicrobium sp.]